jgi:hypothetical protein
LNSVDFNEKEMLDYQKANNKQMYNFLKDKIETKQSESFLSKVLYYETINFQDSE